MRYTLLPLATTILSISSCVTHRDDASDLVQKTLHGEASIDPVNVQGLPNGITLVNDNLKDDVVQILAQRGGKDPKDLWIVDRHKGEIRIRKSRLDGVIYPPGAAVEFWRKGNDERWMRRPTA